MRRGSGRAIAREHARRAVSDNRYFVQFPHPGREHSPDFGDWKKWNRQGNGRKFVEIGGAWLESLGSRAQEGKLWAWAEWEAESRVLRCFEPSDADSPRYLWEPTWLPKPDYWGMQNTDPSIFGGFYYTDCKQHAYKGLRQLERGSVIVFGSKKNARWVMDTVFVVADYVDHTSEDYKPLLEGRVPSYYWDVAMAPTHQGVQPPNNRRMYRGATHDVPVDGMFSFFPCLPAETEMSCPRPWIELPREYFTPGLSQGVKGCSVPLDKSTVTELWRSIADQILDQRLLLGVRADSPCCGGPPRES